MSDVTRQYIEGTKIIYTIVVPARDYKSGSLLRHAFLNLINKIFNMFEKLKFIRSKRENN